MAAQKDTLAYILEQLDGLEGFRYRAMMGGYIFYCKDKIFGGIYEPGFMVKITPASTAAMPESTPEPAYAGAKALLPVTILDDRAALQAMIRAMYPELPAPKTKPARTAKKQAHT